MGMREAASNHRYFAHILGVSMPIPEVNNLSKPLLFSSGQLYISVTFEWRFKLLIMVSTHRLNGQPHVRLFGPCGVFADPVAIAI